MRDFDCLAGNVKIILYFLHITFNFFNLLNLYFSTCVTNTEIEGLREKKNTVNYYYKGENDTVSHFAITD